MRDKTKKGKYSFRLNDAQEAEIIYLFKTMKDNRSSLIAEMTGVGLSCVSECITRYLSSLQINTKKEYIIIESKMNFEDI